MGCCREVIILKLHEEFRKNRKLILDNWTTLVKENLNMKNDFEFKVLIELFEYIIDNFINYLKVSDTKVHISDSMDIAETMVSNGISFGNFMRGIQYFQEIYIQTLLKSLDIDIVSQCLILANRIYTKTISDITYEYRNINDPTLTALVKLSELKDDTTGKHAERTKKYAVALSIELSKKINLDDSFIKSIGKASLLHDIGKVAIKDEILLKPGKLTSDEFEQIKRHTIIGAQTIDKVINTDRSINEYLIMAKSIALCHHEKYDGTGYPNNLSGKKIPLSARIFALVDAYDVITSKRPYKEAASHEEAILRITTDSGSHFDPDIVNAFMAIQHIFKNINESYKSKPPQFESKGGE